MPRFHFNLRYRNHYAPDLEGEELPDARAVPDRAKTVALSMMQTRSALIRDYFDCTFEITDEGDREVLRFPFGDAVEGHEDEDR
jgi:hypothetical protein